MAYLIDKDALVAEIEKLMYAANLEADIASTGECFDEKVAEAKYQLCKRIISIINTLEVKEVDLEKEIKNAINEYYNECEKKLQEMNDNDTDMSFLQLDNFAKHFFELGLKARQG